MTRREFEDEMGRLADGFREPLTAPRVEALWRNLGRVHVHDFGRAVDAALCDRMFPLLSRLWQEIEKASEFRRAVEREQADLAAKRLLSGDVPAITPFGQFCAHAIATAGKAPQGQFNAVFAGLLAEWIAADPATRSGYEDELQYWILAARPGWGFVLEDKQVVLAHGGMATIKGVAHEPQELPKATQPGGGPLPHSLEAKLAEGATINFGGFQKPAWTPPPPLEDQMKYGWNEEKPW